MGICLTNRIIMAVVVIKQAAAAINVTKDVHISKL